MSLGYTSDSVPAKLLVAGALKLHQQGQLDQAESLYARVLAAAPASETAHADALHLLGVLRGQRGDVPGGIGLIERAIAANGRFSAYHNNLGNLRKRAGDTDGAEQSYRRAILLDAKNADAHLNLGKLLDEAGRRGEARAAYQKTLRLNPRSVELQMSMGRLEEAEGNTAAALARFREAARLTTADPSPHLMVAKMLVAAGEVRQAESSLQRALELDPNFASAHYNLAVLAQQSERLPEAVAHYRRAIELGPADAADAWNNLGVVLSKMGERQPALAAFLKAVELKPNFDGAFHNLGKEAMKLGADKAAEKYFLQAIELNPRNALVHHDLGALLQAQGLLSEASEIYRRAVALSAALPKGASIELRANLEGVLAMLGDRGALARFGELVTEQPDYADGRFNWSMALLLHGEYEAGFREYEWRRKVAWLSHNYRPLEKTPQPIWDGSPLEGRTLLLSAEQGFGDTLQFIRYLPQVAARARAGVLGRVVLEVQPALCRLLRGLGGNGLPGVDLCIPQTEPAPEFDVHLPLMSLPHIFPAALEDVPGPLMLDVPIAERPAGRCSVGLVWAGNPSHSRDRLRSISLDVLEPLTVVPGVTFVSLQTGAPAAQIASLGAPFRFAKDCSAVRDFADTAEIIAGLDLVITIDSAVAHLTGSLGKPVWLLIANMPDWRWGFAGETTPWYPQARLFRQAQPGEWSPVIEAVAARLRLFVQECAAI